MSFPKHDCLIKKKDRNWTVKNSMRLVETDIPKKEHHKNESQHC